MKDFQSEQNKIVDLLTIADRRLGERHPWLKHQDALGLGIFLLSFLGMIVTSILYLQDSLSGWATFFINALLSSLLHELEHDLIHTIYFRKQVWMQDLLFAGIWIFHGNTLSPWYRKKLHINHHKESGQTVDIEERLIGNGMPWGWKRLLLTLDNVFAGVFLFRTLKKEIPNFKKWDLIRARGVIGFTYTLIWMCFLASWVYKMVTSQILFNDGFSFAINFLTITMVGPNMLRQMCLAFISSNSHYYGIERMNMLQQCQVLNHWVFFPLHLFCFNFGSTHVLHHFLVPQPFFRRQMMAREGHEILKRFGIRNNDLESMAHANRY